MAPRKRNPVARAVKQMRHTVVPNKKRDTLPEIDEQEWQDWAELHSETPAHRFYRPRRLYGPPYSAPGVGKTTTEGEE